MASQTKERGMIFNAEMVRALLDGNKTQTRRPVTLKEPWSSEVKTTRSVGELHFPIGGLDQQCGCAIKSPFGQVGDRIWVRETFGYEIRNIGGTPHEKLVYRASKPQAVHCYDCNGNDLPMKWKPSIHMPRWASRIALEITDIRVERLQDISEEDAIAEGVSPNCAMNEHSNCDHNNEWVHYGRGLDNFPAFSAKESYESLWDSLYGNWNDNPWAWCISFEVIN